ncbi:hypothetical protein GCM10009801_54280 [Streptomyces albiaxialis]|uniref:ABC transporter permease n=1 Tax=Streptomyces albiaxialis TaxID=329523 RepID=A0ABN2WDD5_9ACTN
MAAGAGQPGELLRRELAGRLLFSWTLLVLGLCAGTGMIFAGIHDRVRNTATSPTAALGSLIAGILVTLAALALSALLALRSRDRVRLFRAHGPEVLAIVPPLRGARAAWTTVSTLGLLLGALFLVAGLVEAAKDDPYEQADPYIYAALLLWAVLVCAAGVAGIVKARRFTSPGPGTGPGTAPVDLAKPGRGTARPARPTAPPLYLRISGEPLAPHRLSPRLAARIAGLSRGAAVALALLATLVGGVLAAATALLPVHLGTGTFWLLFFGTGLYLLVLYLELIHYGPRRRYAVLLAGAFIGLLVVAGTGFSTAVLLDRGRWVDTTVESVRDSSKGGPSCALLPEGDDTVLSRRMSCRGLDVGDEVRVFHDPDGEASPRRSEPGGMTGFTVGWNAVTAAALGLALMSALYGHRRRRELAHAQDPGADRGRGTGTGRNQGTGDTEDTGDDS